MIPPEPPDDPGQHEVRSGISGRHAHLARVEVVDLPGELAVQPVHAFHEGNRELVEALPGRGERDARAIAFEQGGVQLVLELAHVEGHRRLADEELLGCPGHASEPRGIAEGLELPETVPLLIELLAVRGHQRDPDRKAGSSNWTNRSAASDGTSSRRMSTPYRRSEK